MPKDGEPSHKKKRLSKDTADSGDDSGKWECSLCTYQNKFEAFKCEMCETRKGTSTRKPKLNDNVVERQKTVQNFVVQQQEKVVNSFRKRAQHSLSPTNSRQSPVSSCSSSNSRPTTKQSPAKKRQMILIPDSLIYRTSPKKLTVIVNNEPATITEYRRKPNAADRVSYLPKKRGHHSSSNSTASSS